MMHEKGQSPNVQRVRGFPDSLRYTQTKFSVPAMVSKWYFAMP